jgi:hypothetical protein
LDAASYAKILIDAAERNLDPEHLEYLKNESYPTEFDRALRYISGRPWSGVRILKSKTPKASPR